MTVNIEIIGLLVIFSFFLVLSEWYLKRILKIKVVRKSILSGDRKKVYVFIEVILFISFIASTFYVAEKLGTFSSIPMLLFFLLTSLFRGIEEWKENKSEKGYYHDWLGSLMLLIMILFLLIV